MILELVTQYFVIENSQLQEFGLLVNQLFPPYFTSFLNFGDMDVIVLDVVHGLSDVGLNETRGLEGRDLSSFQLWRTLRRGVFHTLHIIFLEIYY